MIGRTNAKRGGSGNVTTVTLASGASGETITATRTGKTKTATTNASGVATFKNLDMGYDWTFSWSTFSKTEKIDQLTESIELGGYTLYLGCSMGPGGESGTIVLHTGSTSGPIVLTIPVQEVWNICNPNTTPTIPWTTIDGTRYFVLSALPFDSYYLSTSSSDGFRSGTPNPIVFTTDGQKVLVLFDD